MQDKALFRLLGVTAAFHLVFAIWPQIDIYMARLFLQPDGSFWLVGHPLAEFLRNLVWAASLATAYAAVFLLASSLWLGAQAQTSWRLWAFVTSLYFIGPGLLVNGLLKEYWGRARPADIIAFGGDKQFTPPFQIANECLGNCSFVSGEAAAATVLALVIGVAVLPRGPAARFGFWQLGLFTLAIGVAFQRVASGRHFLSDVIFAALFMLIIACVLHRVLKVPAPSNTGLLTAVQADISATLEPAHTVLLRVLPPIGQKLVKVTMAIMPRIRVRVSQR